MTICDLSDETGMDPHTIIKNFQKLGIFRKKNTLLPFEQTVNSKYSNEIRIYENGKISWSKNSKLGLFISDKFNLRNNKYIKPKQTQHIKQIHLNINQPENDNDQDEFNIKTDGIFSVWKKKSKAEAEQYNNDNGYDFTE